MLQGETCLKKERPNFGDKQIKSLNEIKIGGIYIRHFSVDEEKIRILSKSDFAMRCEHINKDDPLLNYIDNYFYTDCGVLPYTKNNGEIIGWHRVNWLEKEE